MKVIIERRFAGSYFVSNCDLDIDIINLKIAYGAESALWRVTAVGYDTEEYRIKKDAIDHAEKIVVDFNKKQNNPCNGIWM